MSDHVSKNTQPEQTVIGRSCRLRGDMALDGDAIVLGSLEGSLEVGGDLRIGPEGMVAGSVRAGSLHAQGQLKGDVHCRGSVQLAGRLEGDVVCGDTVELAGEAVLVGDLFARAMRVIDGASYEGHVTIGPNAAAESAANQRSNDHRHNGSRAGSAAGEPHNMLPRITETETVVTDTDRTAVGALLRRRPGAVLTRPAGAAGA